MATGDVIALSAVVLALALGVYGVLRDTRDRREAKDARVRRQAERVSVWTRVGIDRSDLHHGEGQWIYLFNGSELPLTGALVVCVGTLTDGTSHTSRWSMDDVVPQHTAKVKLENYQRPTSLSSLRYYCEFRDGSGRGWRRYTDGTLEAA